jgi:uncharacterized protein (DUF2249 family)
MAERAVDALATALIRSLRQLGEAGRPEAASRIAADAWSGVRRDEPRIADRINGVMHHLARLEAAEAAGRSTIVSEQQVLDVRSEPPVRRHTLIFATFDALAPGTAFELRNDHDPKPLYYQFAAEHAGSFTWDYLEEGPEVWRVRIGRTDPAPVQPGA